MGFRSIAWEEDWTTGLQIDRYLRTGRGHLDALVRRMSPQWQSRQVAQWFDLIVHRQELTPVQPA